MPAGSPHHPASPTDGTAAPGDAGFSLIEVLVALGLIGIVMAAVTSFFVGTMATIGELSGYHTATQLATKQMENVRATTKVSDLTGGTTITVLGGIGYDVTWDVRRCWQQTGTVSPVCTYSTTRPTQPAGALWADLVQVAVTVSWPDRNCSDDRCAYRTDTLISRGELEPMFGTGGTP